MPQENPDRNFSTEIDRAAETPEHSALNHLDEPFDDPIIRRRVGELITLVMRKNLGPSR